jgi:hypothetical protein
VGNGDGTFTPTYAAFNLDKYGFPSTAADINGDGRADLIEVDGWPSSYHVIPAVPGPTVQLQLAAQPIIGSKGTLIVNLSLPASGSVSVQLSASDPSISIPASVTIPSGSLSVNVPFTIASNYNSSRVFALSATLSGQTATIYSYQTTAALAGIRLSSYYQSEDVPPAGTTRDYSVVVYSMAGYTSDSVQFTCQGLPAGATCQFGSASLALPAGQSLLNSLTVQISASIPLGVYPFQVMASDGASSAQLPLKLAVADFSLSASPASLKVVEGNSAVFNVTIQGTTGWTDLVNVTCTIAPPVANNSSCPGNGLTPTGTVPITVPTYNMPVGDFTLQFSGSADGVTRQSSAVTLHVQNAAVSVSPITATIAVGSSATFNVSVTSQNGLTDQFTFSCPGLPAGLSCTFSPPGGTLPANGTLSSTLTVAVNAKPALAAPKQTSSRSLPFGLLVEVFVSCAIFWLLFESWQRAVRSPAFSAYGISFGVLLVVVVLGAVSCGGGGSSTGPPPPPAPTVTLSASPTSIATGNSTTLTWSSQNATQLAITPSIGPVSLQGSMVVSPNSSTTYTITATGPGGSATASAGVTVTAAPAVVSLAVQASSPSITVTTGYVTITIQ